MSSQNAWRAAVEDSTGGSSIAEGPVAEFDIDVNPRTEEGAIVEDVDAEGEPGLEVVSEQVDEAGDEVTEASEVVQNLEETQDTLLSYQHAIESRIASGQGVTPGEWEMIQIGIRKAVPKADKLLPSAEAFGRGQISASNEALASIKQGLIAIWEAIRDAIMSLVNRAKKWWYTTFDAAPRLRARATAISKACDSLGNLDKSDSFQLPIWNQLTSFGGKALDPSSYVQAARDLDTLCTYAVRTFSQDVDDYIEGVESDIDQIINAARKNAKSAPNKGTLKSLNIKLPKSSRKKIKRFDNVNTDVTGEILGGKIMVAGNGLLNANPNNVADINSDAKAHFLRVVAAEEGTKKGDKDVEFKPLQLEQIRQICTYVENIGSVIEGYRVGWEKREKIVKKVVDKVNSKVKEVDRDDVFKENPDARNIVVATMRGFQSITTGNIEDTKTNVNYFLSSSKALLFYCSRSQARYSKA